MVGVGVNHDELVKHAEASLGSIPEGMATTDEQCEYVGGKDIVTIFDIFISFSNLKNIFLKPSIFF